MRTDLSVFLLVALGYAPAALAQPPAPSQPPRPVASVNTQPRVNVADMPRPIDMRDTLWIEDLTVLEVRDLIKAGKTTALILTGGIEENGPYLTTGKHNNVLRAMGDPIARALGNALIAPIVTLEPGNPERIRMPGTVLLSPETFKAVVSDMAVSLKTQGFKHIVLLGDSGGNIKPLTEAAEALNASGRPRAATSEPTQSRVLQLRRGGGVREDHARHPRADGRAARRLLHLRDHRRARSEWRPHAGAR